MFGRVAAFAIALAVLAPADARASACCGEASGLGARLLEAEDAALLLRAGVRGRIGSFGSDGAFNGLPDGVTDAEMTVAVASGARVTKRLEMGAEVSGQLNVRSLQGESNVGGGLGDAHAHVRFAVVTATESRWVPGIYPVVGAVIPTGVPASRSTPGSLQADVTGRGNAEVVLGISVEKTYEGAFFARTEASVGFFVPETIDTVAVARAPRLALQGVVGPVLDPLVIGAGVSYEHEPAPPGAAADTVGRSKLELVFVAAVDIDMKTSLIASVRAPLPVDDFGTNELASVSADAGIRFGFF